MTKPKISILLPTRKRTQTLVNSINSLLANAADTSRIEILIAYDDDDEESREFFANTWADYIGQCSATTKVFETERFGYLRLYKYVNFLAEQASGDWIMFWNDDAVMLTENWDDAIVNETGWFGLLRMPCVNMDHPFALFPIVPRSWIDFFGKVSCESQ
jgi:glycosyltransferase involved in cell wall biosynthesis